jgi:hypothetical protein
MNIDYSINLGRPSVKSLIAALQKIVDDNPEINFHKVGVTLNDEYNYDYVTMQQWETLGKQRVCVDIC